MFRSLLVILFLLLCQNLRSQNIDIVKLDSDILISDFIKKYEISSNDFFILNPSFTESRFNHSIQNLNSKILAGTSIRLLENNVKNNEKISFISHKIKRNQSEVMEELRKNPAVSSKTKEENRKDAFRSIQGKRLRAFSKGRKW